MNEWREPPVGHHLDETTRAEEFRLDHRRQFTDPAARKQGGSETGEIIPPKPDFPVLASERRGWVKAAA